MGHYWACVDPRWRWVGGVCYYPQPFVSTFEGGTYPRDCQHINQTLRTPRFLRRPLWLREPPSKTNTLRERGAGLRSLPFCWGWVLVRDSAIALPSPLNIVHYSWFGYGLYHHLYWLHNVGFFWVLQRIFGSNLFRPSHVRAMVMKSLLNK